MRLWSLSPAYLDTKGLLAVWREGLLAKKVLEGKTKGYSHHPQLIRFRTQEDPLGCINYYLYEVWEEAHQRGYRFDRSKIQVTKEFKGSIPVTRGQLTYEWEHLWRKLSRRAPQHLRDLLNIHAVAIQPHPLFRVVSGPIEGWEKLLPQ